jgi:hypothetical protein
MMLMATSWNESVHTGSVSLQHMGRRLRLGESCIAAGSGIEPGRGKQQ